MADSENVRGKCNTNYNYTLVVDSIMAFCLCITIDNALFLSGLRLQFIVKKTDMSFAGDTLLS